MTLFGQLTDDQFALAGCGGALVVAFAVMTVSYHLGAFLRRSQSNARDFQTSGVTPALTTDADVATNPAGRRAA